MPSKTASNLDLVSAKTRAPARIGRSISAKEPEPAKGQGGEDGGDAITREEITSLINTTVNAALTTHTKRQAASLEKTIADSIARAFESRAKPEDGGDGDGGTTGKKPGGDAKPSPEMKAMADKLARLEKENAEEKAARRETEQRAKRDAVRGTLREQLEAAGIKGARSRAALALLEAEGVVRFDAETGTPSIVVKRSRSKGAAADEMTFDDLGEGVKDWLKSPDAGEFIPAPAAKQPTNGNRTQSSTQQGGASGGARKPMSIDDAVNATVAQIESGDTQNR
jgi:hypothetical protein